MGKNNQKIQQETGDRLGIDESGMNRPTGVTILAILEYLNVPFNVFIGYIVFSMGITYYFNAGPLGMLLGGIGFTLGIIHLAVGWGLWNLKKRAYQAAIILYIGLAFIYVAAINVYNLFIAFPSYIIFIGGNVTGGYDTIWIIFQLIVYAIILYYLTRPRIKGVFGITGYLR